MARPKTVIDLLFQKRNQVCLSHLDSPAVSPRTGLTRFWDSQNPVLGFDPDLGFENPVLGFENPVLQGWI